MQLLTIRNERPICDEDLDRLAARALRSRANLDMPENSAKALAEVMDTEVELQVSLEDKVRAAVAAGADTWPVWFS